MKYEVEKRERGYSLLILVPGRQEARSKRERERGRKRRKKERAFFPSF
jgi:hypothetical protein